MKKEILFIISVIFIHCTHKNQKQREMNIVNFENKNGFEYIICNNQDRNIDYCIEIYEPVCGWTVSHPSECKGKYCRESFANSCFACKDKKIIGYTKGNCK